MPVRGSDVVLSWRTVRIWVLYAQADAVQARNERRFEPASTEERDKSMRNRPKTSTLLGRLTAGSGFSTANIP